MSVIWTDELIEQLKTLYMQGYSFGAIARILACGLSRNAVIGKAHRIGLRSRHDPSTKRLVHPVAQPKPEAASKPTHTVRNLPPIQKVKSMPVPGITIANVEFDQCRFPLWPDDGQVGEGPMCGAKVERGPYCHTHADRCMPLVAHPRSREARQQAETLDRLKRGVG